jgi:hypothetical protein
MKNDSKKVIIIKGKGSIGDLLTQIFDAINDNHPNTTSVDEINSLTRFDAIESLAEKYNLPVRQVKDVLLSIKYFNPWAAFSIVARELAILLDRKYKDDISNSEKIYVISSGNGTIQEINKAHIKNYKNFAAFRTIEDAKIVCSILKDDLREMFKDGRK